MKVLKYIILTILVVGAIATYYARSFVNAHQHHQLNEGGGVLIVAIILVFWLFPDGDDD